jgi:hypothetical protein
VYKRIWLKGASFSRKKYRFGESEKKSLRCLCQIIAMSSVKHRDVFGKPLGRLVYIIGKTFLTIMKTLSPTPIFRVKGNFRVKGRRFTLYPASGAGFRHIVKGESSIRKPPE